MVLHFNVRSEIFFGLSFVLLFFAIAQSIIEIGVRRFAIFFLITGIIGYAAEVIGTSSGVPFGKYRYTDFLGEKVLGVPIVVPLVWFVIAYITFSITFGSHGSRLTLKRGVILCALASFGSVAWDLLIDPMFTSYGYWIWDMSSSVPFLSGIPVSNFVGWFVLVFLMIFAFFIQTRKRNVATSGFKERNTSDSRLVYAMLILDGCIANYYLGNYLAIAIGLFTTVSFLIVTYSFSTNNMSRGLKAT
jgi:uncharacterized membrane protein